jgi:hypothetical protein
MGILGDLEKKASEAVGSFTKASIDFRNETGNPIRVVMDNNREVHDIAPHGQATFSEAHIGDAPTFRVVNAANGQEIFSRRINPITTPHSSLGFNGQTF